MNFGTKLKASLSFLQNFLSKIYTYINFNAFIKKFGPIRNYTKVMCSSPLKAWVSYFTIVKAKSSSLEPFFNKIYIKSHFPISNKNISKHGSVFVSPALAGKHIGIALSTVVCCCCENGLTFGSNFHMLWWISSKIGP